MSLETFAEQIERLEMMADPDQDTWDLSDNDRAAIRMAGKFARRFMAILGPELLKRREDQDAEHGGPDHDDTHTAWDWLRFVRRFASIAGVRLQEGDRDGYESAMFDIGALAVATIQSSRRKTAKAG